jgi:hypothetical protein
MGKADEAHSLREEHDRMVAHAAARRTP